MWLDPRVEPVGNRPRLLLITMKALNASISWMLLCGLVLSASLLQVQSAQRLLPIQERILAFRAERLEEARFQPHVSTASFAPGTTPEAMQEAQSQLEAYLEEQRAGLPPAFRLGPPPGHWDTTATDGTDIPRGAPVTLTWSVVPDGTSIPSFGRGAAGVSNLRASLTARHGSEGAWLALFQQVFDRWGELTGITYVYEPNDDGAEFSSFSLGGTATPGILGVRGDVRIGGRPIDGNSNTLAFNFGAPNGEMIIDTADNSFDDLSNNSRLFRNAVSHEHGHGLGLKHVCPMDQTKLMEPIISTLFDGPQPDDILGGQRQHGDPLEDNDTIGQATVLGSLSDGFHSLGGLLSHAPLSLDGTGDVDFFQFEIPVTGRRVTLSLRPVGSVYLEGEQNTNGTCSAGVVFDSTSVQNLAMQLIGSDQSTVVATADSRPVGEQESLFNLDLPPGTGPFYLKITGAGTDSVQRYDLDLTLRPVNDLSVSLAMQPASVRPGQTVTCTATLFNSGPISATGVTLVHNVPAGFTFVSANSTQGVVVHDRGNPGILTASVGTLASGASAAVTFLLTTSSVGTHGISVTASRGEADAEPSNNNASVNLQVIRGPDHVEEFTAFPGYQGTFPASVASDTGGSYSFLNFGSGGTTTPTGFGLDTALSQNGKGFTLEGGEASGMWLSADLSPSIYTNNTHMLAFWFRFQDNSANGNGHSTQLLTVWNQGASGNSDYSYVVRAGIDINGIQGLGFTLPTFNNPSRSHITYAFAEAAPDVWHRAVIHYTSSSSSSNNDARLRLWVDPSHAGADPVLEFGPESDPIVSGVNGPFGRYGYAQTLFSADALGPQVHLDSLATWNGFGTPNVNDLQAGLDFLDSAIPAISLVATSATQGEGQSGTTTFDFAVVRTGPNGVTNRVDFQVAGEGGNPANASDFQGGLPSGSILLLPGETSKVLSIPVLGDTDIEADESFSVTLSLPQEGAVLQQSRVTGVILNDDFPLDFGDAPDPRNAQSGRYPTLLANDGARHVLLPGAPRLGAEVDAESDGLPAPSAKGDDTTGTTDDEDGILPPTLVLGTTVQVPVTVSTATGLLNAWIDFNGDGLWESPSEQVATNLSLGVGGHVLNVQVPIQARTGPTFSRFRISTTGGLGPDGLAADGEVEDHELLVVSGVLPITNHVALPVIQPQQGVDVVFQGTPGLTYRIEMSTNLVHWSTLTTLPADANGVVFHRDAEIQGKATRFYRAARP